MTEIDLLTPTKVLFSKRRTISIIISNNGDMTVRAPLKCPDKNIMKFIAEKSEWIIKKRLEFLNRNEKKISLNDNDEISILDKKYKVILSDISNVKISDGFIYVSNTNTKEKFVAFIKKYSKTLLKERLDSISKLAGIKYNKFSISSAKTNWGSCSYNNTIHLNFRLILTSNEILNYVIIHELCHTIQKNHSTKFWDLVKSACPNYKELKKKLNDYTFLLNQI